jgi:predicted TIM-barrel fold metal-dependent hydrolase
MLGPDVPPWEGDTVDCDVHAALPSLDALTPYLEPHWVEFIRERGVAAPQQATHYPPNAPTTVAQRWRPGDGRRAASDVALLQEHVLDPQRTSVAILNAGNGVDELRHPDFAAAIAAGLNDWVAAEWLARDSRLRASIVVPMRDPLAAAAEIERVGAAPGFVQVVVPVVSDRLYGKRAWRPMYEAAVEHGLVLALHFGGTSDGPSTPTGWPSWFLEEHAGHVQAYLSQLTSLIAEGVFEQHPGLRVAILEGGFAWLPPLMWRLDHEWKGLRRDIPWVRRPPSETIRQHVRLSVAPLDAGPPAQLGQVVEQLGSEEMLMFASDYPHWHEEDISTLLDAIPRSMARKVMSDNARALYGL